jgi:DNA-binding CsgD family transcriptional regulator
MLRVPPAYPSIIEFGQEEGSEMILAEEALLKLVGLTYDAALDETKWPRFLEAFANAAGSSSAYIRSTDLKDRVNFMVSVGYDPALRTAYANHFIKVDYYSTFFKNAELNAVAHEQMTHLVGISPSEQKKTEYFNDYIKRLGSHEHAMGVVLAREGDQALQFAVQRSKRVGEYGESQVRLMSTLAPHVTRAVQVHRKLSSVTVEKEWALGALDQLRMSVILTNSGGTPMFVNHAAEQMLMQADGINTHQGRLILSTPSETARLYKLIEDAAKGAPGTNRGGDIRIALTNGESLHGVVMPIPLEFTARWNIGVASGCVAVFLSKPGGLHLSAQRLAEQYGLTPAEGRLAAKLTALRSVEQAAEDLCLSVHTARSQLKSIFAKTGAKSQSELLMLFATGTLAQCRSGKCE